MYGETIHVLLVHNYPLTRSLTVCESLAQRETRRFGRLKVYITIMSMFNSVSSKVMNMFKSHGPINTTITCPVERYVLLLCPILYIIKRHACPLL